MKIAKTADAFDGDSILVMLFLCKEKRVRGWFVGPVSLLKSGVSVPYLAPSRRVLGEVAVVRATHLARERNLSVCIVDPDGLWNRIWQSSKVS